MEEPDREQKAMLLRVHKNLGHPQRGEFSRALRVGGVRPLVRAWVRQHFRCPERDARRHPG
eukprot:482628-Alexandrium_andersonii.AAC.1